MTVSTNEVILGRIKEAGVSSPIAVFKIKSDYGTDLDAVFANTVVTQRKIKSGDKSLVGIYDNSMDKSKIRRDLTEARIFSS